MLVGLSELLAKLMGSVKLHSKEIEFSKLNYLDFCIAIRKIPLIINYIYSVCLKL